MSSHTDEQAVKLLEAILHLLRRIERKLFSDDSFVPATSVVITQIRTTPVQTISPGNSPTFQASLQPVNAGPFLAASVAWSVTGDPGASVAPISTDPTGLTATLTLSSAVVLGAILPLTVVVTNQDGSTVTATDTLTVVAQSTPPPAFVPATGVAIQQLS